MSLTTTGKNYIAEKFGINNCMVYTGLSWTTYGSGGTQENETGGTAKLVSRLITSGITSVRVTSPGSGTYTLSNLTSNNQNQTVDYSDASWISNNDGYPSGETQYCIGTGPTPTPTPSGPTPVPTVLPPGMAGEYIFKSSPAPPSGAPSISLRTSDIVMRQSTSDYHFELNDLFITNNSPHKAYAAVRIKLFQGSHGSCPTSGEVFDGMDRVSTSRNVRIKTLDPGEIEDVNVDVYQPSNILGVHTVCIIVHGSFDKSSLENEVAYISG